MKLLFLAISSKRLQGAIAGLIAGYFLGSLWVGKGQDEMMRQIVEVVRIARGG